MPSEVPAIIRWDQAYNRNGDPKLPRSVVNAIRTHMNNHTLEGWVKAETLADYTGLQVRGVRKQIAANVKAGWLEVVESGNSSGKANTYRLTYPKGVPQDTVAVADFTQRVSYRPPLTPQGCPIGPVKGVLQDTPTTPRTSPQEKFIGTTPEENHALQRRVPDPSGSGVIDPQLETTMESNHAPQRRVPNGAPERTVSRYHDPFVSTCRVNPFCDEPQPCDCGQITTGALA